MTWPTLEQVASMTWEETRFWINTLPGTKSPEQVTIIRAICRKNVSYWPKPDRPYIAIETPPAAAVALTESPPCPPLPPPPKPKPKAPAKPKASADLGLFKSLFGK